MGTRMLNRIGRLEHPVLRWGIPLVSVAAAAAATAALPDLLAPIRLLFFWCAILLSAMFGVPSAIAATILSALAIPISAFEPIGSFNVRTPDDITRIALFAVFAGTAGVAVGALRAQYLRAEQALAELSTSEFTYRALAEVNSVPQAIWTATPDGRISWTDEWLNITGQTREEVETGGGMSVVAPDDAQRTYARWQAALESKSIYTDEIRIRVREGRYRWFAVRAVPVIAKGELIRWVGVIADIHDRKQREWEAEFLNRASAVLGSSLDYEKTLRDIARLCVPALADWCTIDMAREGEPYVRVAVEHVDPAKVQLAFELDRTHRLPPDVDPVAQVMRTGQPRIVEHRSDEMLAKLVRDENHLAIARSLGVTSWLAVPMPARGRIVGVLTLISAESEHSYSAKDLPLAEELARRAASAVDNAYLYAQAQQANRTKDEFLATLSHELRTPLTTILGWGNLLQIGGVDEVTSRVAIDTIVRSAKNQRKLIDELLDLSRIVSGKLELALEQVDLVSLMNDVVTAQRPAAEAKQIELRFEHPPRPVFIKGDADRLSQIGWNLLGNAIKFTQAQGKVFVYIRTTDGHAEIEVSDTGEGIDPAFLPHVWERFRQADSSSSRQHGGLGLGLAVVRYLVEAHGGSVRAHSEGAGKGATFTAAFPLGQESAMKSAM